MQAILRHAEEAENDPKFFTIYKQTQPKPIFAEVSDDEEEGKDK